MNPSTLLHLVAIAMLTTSASPAADDWIPLFNGRDLDGWTPKFAGAEVGANPNQIFRVEDGLLKVSYTDADEKFVDGFGHLFYQTPYSHYRIRAEFRFTGDQAEGGPGWAYRNNGFMLHCQAPETMDFRQNFPDSIEVQFLGSDPAKGGRFAKRAMGNLFTPGTKVILDGKLHEGGNDTSSSPPYSGLDWITVEAEVRGDKIIHYVEGQEVLRYSGTQLDDGTPLTSGFIAIQAETHPTEFRKIELLPLPGNRCVPNGMDPLFDGESLSGWKVASGSEGHWKVIDGTIDYDAGSTAATNHDKHLWTEASYGNFELYVDWRLKDTGDFYQAPYHLPDGSRVKLPDGSELQARVPHGDSGILLRGEVDSQCNIWTWPVGSGEVWGYRRNPRLSPVEKAALVPRLSADFPVGQWNRFIIRLEDDRLTVNLNGHVVIDRAALPGVPQTGPIGLQHHGGQLDDGSYHPASSLIQFRQLYLKSLD